MPVQRTNKRFLDAKVVTFALASVLVRVGAQLPDPLATLLTAEDRLQFGKLVQRIAEVACGQGGSHLWLIVGREVRKEGRSLELVPHGVIRASESVSAERPGDGPMTKRMPGPVVWR